MQVDSPQKVRNLGFAGHGGTGKTTLASALLYTGGVVNRLGRVEDGNATTDFDAEEVERNMSIGLAPCFVPWRKHKVNIVDLPGAGIFGVEMRAGLRAVDTMVLVINGAAGVEVTTEAVWKFAEQISLPVLVHLNKMDRENADFGRALESVQKLARTVVPIQLPIGQEQGFEGVVDLITEKAYRFEKGGDGKATAADVPGDMADAVEEARNTLIEAVAESRDELMEKFFEEGTLTTDELIEGLRTAVQARQIFPLTIGAAPLGVGSSTLLDAAVDYLPCPTDRGTFPSTNLGGEATEVDTTSGPTSALVFKTLNDPFSGKISILRVVSGELSSDSPAWNSQVEETEKLGSLMAMQGKQGSAIAKLVTGDIGGVAKLKHTKTGHTLGQKDSPVMLDWIEIRPPAISYAIEPKSKGDEEKIAEALSRLMEEDLGLKSGRDPQTSEMLLSGSDQLHVEIAISKMHKRSKVDVILHPPKVPYRETIKKPADGHGRHKKQTGGRGQFADCKIIIEPLTDGSEFEFVDEIFGGSIPQGFRPAVEKGIQEARQKGFLAGYPMASFRVRLKDGQYHDVDSSEMAFKIAGSMAYKDAMARAAPTLLEPIMKVEIHTNDDFMGDIMGDLSQRRGQPQGMDTEGEQQIIRATVPMAEMLDYAAALRSITQGRSRYTMEFSHYDEVPKQIQEKIIAAAQKEQEG